MTNDIFITPQPGILAGGREGAEYLLSLDEIPSGIVCYNDFLAVGVYNYLQEKGLRIPQDVSVTGFDNISIAAYLSPPLTTLHQYKFELGEGAARMMLEVLSNRQREERENPPSKKVSLKGILARFGHPPLRSDRVRQIRFKRSSNF